MTGKGKRRNFLRVKVSSKFFVFENEMSTARKNNRTTFYVLEYRLEEELGVRHVYLGSSRPVTHETHVS